MKNELDISCPAFAKWHCDQSSLIPANTQPDGSYAPKLSVSRDTSAPALARVNRKTGGQKSPPFDCPPTRLGETLV